MKQQSFLNISSLILLLALSLFSFFMVYEKLNGAFEEHHLWVNAISLSDDTHFATSSENEIYLWEGHYVKSKLKGHNHAIKSITYSNDKTLLASGSIDQTIKVWSVKEEKVIQELTGHFEGVNAVFFSKDDKKLISAGYDDKLIIWDWESGKIIKEFNILHTAISINKNNLLAFVSDDSLLTVVDLNNTKIIDTIEGYYGQPKFIPNNDIIALKLEDGIFDFVNYKTGRFLKQIQTNQYQFSAFTFSNDGERLITGLIGCDLEIWDWNKNKVIQKSDNNEMGSADVFAISSSNKLFAGHGRGKVIIWNLDSLSIEQELGDGMYVKKLVGILSLMLLAALIIGFLGILSSSENIFSSLLLTIILTVWSLGLFWVFHYLKDSFKKVSISIVWVLTVISVLAVLSLYGAGIALFILPISYSLSFMIIKYSSKNNSIAFSIIINIILSAVICSFVVSSGLWI